MEQNQWQVVSEAPAQAPPQAQPQSTPASTQTSPWQVVNETPQSEPLKPKPDQTTWEWIKDKLSEAFNPNDERNLHPTEVSPGAIARGASFDPTTQKLYSAADHSGVIRGAEKGFVQTASGTSQLAGKVADKVGLRDSSSKGTGILGEAPASAAETEPQGFAEHVGYLGENLTEFVMGDEALKGLSLAEKLGLATKIAKLAESHPTAAKLISAGLRATRTGTVSAGQEAAHGGSAGDVATAGLSGAASSAATEGLAGLAKLAKPGATEIAGETLQTAPKWKGAETAAKVANANQEPAKQVLSNVAKESANAITQKFGQSAPDTIHTFHDAADAVKKAAKPVFEKLDSLSKGEFQTATNELNSANKIARRATSMKDLQEAEKAASTAQAKIDKIFTDSAGKIAPQDLQNAKSAWRSMNTLEKVHGKIDQAFNMPQAAGEIAGTERTLDLSKLQGRLNAAFKAIPKADLESAIGAEGMRNLYALSELGADPARAKTLGEIATQIGSHLSAGGAGTLAGAAVGHAIPGGSIALGLHFLYTHPEAGALVAKGLSKAANPKVIVPSVISLIDDQRQTKTEE
jgi:hypothetical protein